MKRKKLNNIDPLGGSPFSIDNIKFLNIINNTKKSYQELVEILPEIVFELDKDGFITYINHRATELLDYANDELIGMNTAELIFHGKTLKTDKKLKKKFKGEMISGKHYYFLKKDGTYLPIQLNTNEAKKDGEVIGYRGIAIDISRHLKTERTMRENKKLFNIVSEQTIAGISIIQDDKVIFVNDYFARVLGYSVEELKDLDTRQFIKHVHKDDIKKTIKYFSEKKIDSTDDLQDLQYRVISRDGSTRWLHIWSQVIIYQGKESTFSFGIDVTDFRNIEKALQESEQKFSTLIEDSSEVIGIFDEKGILHYGSKSVSRMLGYTPEELVGTYVFDLLHPGDHERILNVFNEMINHRITKTKVEFRLKHKEGSWKNISANAKNMLKDPGIKGIIVNLRDITQRKRAEEKANYYEFHDPLTNLPNREMFQNGIDLEIGNADITRRKKEKDNYIFALMCIGIDKFKNINDIYGPSTGDILLQKIGMRLQKSFREEDIVSRHGGDTYMILLSDISDYEDTIDIIQKAMNIFSDPYIIEENIFKITASIGVCFYPDDGNNREELLKNSEAAMYLAKEKGGNTYRLYNAQMNIDMLNRLQTERELEHAIFHNNFEAYYQPKYDINGNIHGMESLIRWISHTGELILPVNFIDVAEKNGMIVDIGNIILFESVAQNKKWQDQGYPPIPIAVNISPSQFKHPNLITNIKNILAQTELDPCYLELEITESGIMVDEENTIKKLRELNRLGIKITIDDFGTGYSSLAKLKDYPVDTLKIDKSFVENLPENEKSSTITTTIIDLAHNLGFKVIAEGVETKEQLDFLHKHNCDEYQGYYFSVPLTTKEFERILEEKYGPDHQQ